jgi:RimJ/RimL family protein N-acetyltransferase
LAGAHRPFGVASHGGFGSVGELVRICFEDLGVRRVAAECFAANEASWRLMERLGMRREAHTVADSLHRDRGWMDGFAYALLAQEWRAHRSGSPAADSVAP